MDIELALKIFGSGGLLAAALFWWNLYSGRRRIKARIIRETYDPKEERLVEVSIEIEVTNLGDKTTALNNQVIVKAATPKGETRKFNLEIEQPDRDLPSNVPKQFVAQGKLQAVFPFAWFRRYKISVTRGKGVNILHRNVSGKDIGTFRYWIEYIMFVWFNKLPKKA